MLELDFFNRFFLLTGSETSESVEIGRDPDKVLLRVDGQRVVFNRFSKVELVSLRFFAFPGDLVLVNVETTGVHVVPAVDKGFQRLESETSRLVETCIRGRVQLFQNWRICFRIVLDIEDLNGIVGLKRRA